MNSNATKPKLGQSYVLNGLSEAKMSPIMAEQQQRQQQEQQQPQEKTEPQKHHYQQQQQQQFSIDGKISTSSMKNSENMSKFMPPQISTTMVNNINTNSNTNANANANANENANANSNNSTNINTINCRDNSLRTSAPLNNSQIIAVSSVPLHLRPPALPSHLTNISNALSNGTDNGVSASADSSRTSSPSLQGNAQLPTMLPPKRSNDDMRSVHQLQQHQQRNQQQQQPQSTRAIDNSSINSEVTNISNSMQNLNVNQNLNGPMLKTAQLPQKSQLLPLRSQNNMMQPPQVAVTSQSTNSQIYQNNFHYNFKTSALNASHITQTVSTTSAMAPMNNKSQQIIHTAIQSNMQGNQFLSGAGSEYGGVNRSWPSNSSHNVNSATVPHSNPLVQQQQQQQQQQQKQQQQQQSQQHQLNNNQQLVQLNNNNQVTFGRPPVPSAVSMNQRKPLHPNPSQQLPPLIPLLSQQQQLQSQQQLRQQQYATAYAHQQGTSALPPPPQSGIFNNQANMQPLQYQNQKNQQQQHHTSPYTTGSGSQIMQKGFNRLWGQDTIDLMQNRHILSPITLQPPRIVLHNQFHESINCNYSIMRCTLAKIPESNNLLQKSRLPFGILIHPFRDINSLPVIQCPSIVRCRLCRTYINPFVYFVDAKMWKCNLCYRVNELPDDFQFDPATKTYGDVTRRPEVRSSTIEFIAPSEYMLRPPQPAIYLFLFDVSIIAQQCGYLENICNVLGQHLDDMPGDARTQIGFIAYNSQVHFYSMAEGYNQPHEMTLVDMEDPFLPRPDNLLVNLKECKELVKDLLKQLPTRFADTHDPGSALGSALQVAYKLMQASGGRITVFQTCLPTKGLGSLEPREDPNNRSAKDVAHLNPATDFYKRYALECSGYQIAVDLFLLNQQYSDLATISGISKHSGGCIYHFPLYQKTKLQLADALTNCFTRYLTRKIGFEAVMRIRCTRGLQVHTFHGNFFVRSIDLLSLPNVNPDAGYGMQISYEENLSDVKTVCFQAALLYTNSEGERRIRVHTLCLPVSTSLPEIMHAADSEAIIGLLSKMAVDRSLTSNVADAREAFINATIDIFNSFKIAQNLPIGQTGQLIAPRSLALMPLYILALLKHPAFRVGTSTRLDDRFYAMECLKSLPLDQLMKFVYPEFYKIDTIFYQNSNSDMNSNANINTDEEENDIVDVPRLQLSAEYLDLRSIYLMDCGTLIMIYVGLNVPVTILENVFGIKSTSELADYVYGLPNVDSTENAALRSFIRKLNDEKPYNPIIQIIRDTSTAKSQFIEKLIDDRNESSLSYYEFLQHIRAQVK